MQEIGKRLCLKGSAQPAGLLVLLYFTFKFLAVLHLGILGKPVEAQTGMLPPGDFQEAGEKVPYFYYVGDAEMPYSGWRHDIDYGGQKMTAIYSPILSRYHLSLPDRDIKSCFALWSDFTYWLRLSLQALGIAFGVFIFFIPQIFAGKPLSASLLPGLERHDPYGN
jgi:hypothetical protein